jgi:4-alpha-glucanotransferase
MAKLDGALKVNNFLRKKECESREHSDLLQHKLSCLSKDLLASQAESRKHTHQIRHLQLLLKRQKSLLMTPQREDAGGMQDEDEVVKYMVRIEELS